MTKNRQFGFSLVEVMVGLAIMLFTVMAVGLAFKAVLQASAKANNITEAGFLLEEGIEAVKVMRGSNWGNLSGMATNTPYTLVYNNGAWTAQTGKVFVNGLFDRTVILATVYRDSNQNIASSGTIDYNTKKLTATVAWRERSATTTKIISTYVTNFTE